MTGGYLISRTFLQEMAEEIRNRRVGDINKHSPPLFIIQLTTNRFSISFLIFDQLWIIILSIAEILISNRRYRKSEEEKED